MCEYLGYIPIDSICISDNFRQTTPSRAKVERRQQFYRSGAELPCRIIVDSNNVLIDGYCTYIAAKEMGLESVQAYRGEVEVIEASHKGQNISFYWRVPQHLMGIMRPGSVCAVKTKRGIFTVTVKSVIRQQYYNGQDYREVLKVKRA